MTTTTKPSPTKVKAPSEVPFRQQWDACLADPPSPKQGGEKHHNTTPRSKHSLRPSRRS